MAAGEGREIPSLAGLWKPVCALAVPGGHDLVTLTLLHPQDRILAFVEGPSQTRVQGPAGFRR